ncbi:MAG: shikimate kinase, partial [Actinomycetia bacterium]|nr:shikimate kinase [Actinomycetes bacterium]
MASLVLVGITASGTSTVGQQLAVRLGQAFLDCDALIEQRTGRLPREILVDCGEAGLHQLEEQTALEALGADGVLALSSGAVLSPAVRDALHTSPAPVVWLDVSVAVATRRLGMAVLGPALL